MKIRSKVFTTSRKYDPRTHSVLITEADDQFNEWSKSHEVKILNFQMSTVFDPKSRVITSIGIMYEEN